MVLWRISPFHDLNGEGGKLFSARWHTAGRPVVYLAGSASGALLEMCVHTDAEDIPTSFTLLKVSGPDLQPSQVDDRALGTGWSASLARTRAIGNVWLSKAETAVFQVPSALVPETWNYLLNPLHVDALLFSIEQSYEYPFDERLKN